MSEMTSADCVETIDIMGRRNWRTRIRGSGKERVIMRYETEYGELVGYNKESEL